MVCDVSFQELYIAKNFGAHFIPEQCSTVTYTSESTFFGVKIYSEIHEEICICVLFFSIFPISMFPIFQASLKSALIF